MVEYEPRIHLKMMDPGLKNYLWQLLCSCVERKIVASVPVPKYDPNTNGTEVWVSPSSLHREFDEEGVLFTSIQTPLSKNYLWAPTWAFDAASIREKPLLDFWKMDSRSTYLGVPGHDWPVKAKVMTLKELRNPDQWEFCPLRQGRFINTDVQFNVGTPEMPCAVYSTTILDWIAVYRASFQGHDGVIVDDFEFFDFERMMSSAATPVKEHPQEELNKATLLMQDELQKNPQLEMDFLCEDGMFP